ncbi:MAG TPA: hypothetical protein VFG09_06565 [Thermodesulfovibrionales bacterium]|jgi:hypothetical protein|nr:hypothetical protein [Thermodesulfovibrionales bacterium]
MKGLLKNLVLKNRELIWKEAEKMQGFMALLMKPRNTGAGWTEDEKKSLKAHLKHLSAFLPALVIFLLPGGFLLLPLLAIALDRRKKKRHELEK